MFAALPAELEGDLLAGAGDGLRDLPADGGRPGKRNLVDVGVPHERRAGFAGTRHDVHHPARQVGLLQNLGEDQRAERRGLGGLDDDSVAGGEGGRDLPGEHEQREVPRDDLRRDP